MIVVKLKRICKRSKQKETWNELSSSIVSSEMILSKDFCKARKKFTFLQWIQFTWTLCKRNWSSLEHTKNCFFFPQESILNQDHSVGCVIFCLQDFKVFESVCFGWCSIFQFKIYHCCIAIAYVWSVNEVFLQLLADYVQCWQWTALKPHYNMPNENTTPNQSLILFVKSNNPL
jgi:hypothetical protein